MDIDETFWITHLVDQVSKKDKLIKRVLALLDREQVVEAIHALRGDA